MEKKRYFISDRNDLKEVIRGVGTIPSEAVFFGVALDGKPVFLNTHDPSLGPILVVGDGGAGKTNLIQAVAKGIDLTHDRREVRYATITNNSAGWEHGKCCVGAFPFSKVGTRDLISSLAMMANDKKPRNSTILFIDGFDQIKGLGEESLQDLRYIFLIGPSKGIFPILTLNSSKAEGISPWLGPLKTKIFGKMTYKDTVERFGANPKIQAELEYGKFTLREGNKWLHFRAPSI